jgi:hypothetical protein
MIAISIQIDRWIFIDMNIGIAIALNIDIDIDIDVDTIYQYTIIQWGYRLILSTNMGCRGATLLISCIESWE